jgi:hypothetical protein
MNEPVSQLPQALKEFEKNGFQFVINISPYSGGSYAVYLRDKELFSGFNFKTPDDLYNDILVKLNSPKNSL